MSRTWRQTLIVIGGITVVRIIALAFQGTELGADETQYWAWSQNPAFGYFSKPPMIAWVIWFTTHIAGPGEFGVRLGAPLLHAASALLIFQIARRLYDDKIAMWSGITFAMLPAVSLSSGLITTDVPLLFFWALALLGMVDALKGATWKHAAWIGAACGFGLLAKYAMLYFGVCAVLAAAILPEVRRVVLSRYGAAALALTLLILSPNVLWNAAQHFVTVKHTASNADLHGDHFNPGELGDFLFGQMGVFGPVLFVSLAAGLARARRNWGSPLYPRLATALLLCFSMPILAVASSVAFYSRANANWAAPAYIALTPLVVFWLITDGRRLWFSFSTQLHAIIAVVIAVAVAWPGIADYVGMSNAVKRVRGWAEIGGQIALKSTEVDYSAILATDRELMGELLYYVRPRDVPVVMWDFHRPPLNHYELAMKITPQEGRRVLYVSQSPDPKFIAMHFTEMRNLGSVSVQLDPKRIRTLYLFDLQGYQP